MNRACAVFLIILNLCLPNGAGAAKALPVKLQEVTVRPGDTLWGIASHYLKDPTRWNEILRYNKLPSSDPTIALPGMVLKIPVSLIKENLRAALLVYRVNQVLFRKKDHADWQDAELKVQLYRDDSLRTGSASRARVQFTGGDLLSLDENSMAILRPKAEPYDLKLLRGSIQATRSKIITASARVLPKTRDTSYSARVRDDMSTRVEVYAGAADVEGEGSRIEVKAGFGTDVAVGQAPSTPQKLPDVPKFEARIGDTGEIKAVQANRAASSDETLKDIGAELKGIRIGIPVAAYRVQASRTPDFQKVIFDRVYDVDENIDLARSGLPPGTYWWRVATSDLLGAQGSFSQPREYALGKKAARPADSFALRFEVTRPPADGDEVSVPEYRVVGSGDKRLSVTVNGQKVVLDDVGNFAANVTLQKGSNRIHISAADPQGNAREISRKVEFQP